LRWWTQKKIPEIQKGLRGLKKSEPAQIFVIFFDKFSLCPIQVVDSKKYLKRKKEYEGEKHTYFMLLNANPQVLCHVIGVSFIGLLYCSVLQVSFIGLFFSYTGLF